MELEVFKVRVFVIRELAVQTMAFRASAKVFTGKTVSFRQAIRVVCAHIDHYKADEEEFHSILFSNQCLNVLLSLIFIYFTRAV